MILAAMVCSALAIVLSQRSFAVDRPDACPLLVTAMTTKVVSHLLIPLFRSDGQRRFAVLVFRVDHLGLRFDQPTDDGGIPVAHSGIKFRDIGSRWDCSGSRRMVAACQDEKRDDCDSYPILCIGQWLSSNLLSRPMTSLSRTHTSYHLATGIATMLPRPHLFEIELGLHR